MEFICYDDWNQLPDSANSLFSRAAEGSIFFSRPWYDNLLSNLPADCQGILLACVVESETILAILPLKMRSSEHWYALTNLYSSLSTVLLAQDRRYEILECLARGLTGRSFASLRLDPIAEDDGDMHGFQQAMESCGLSCHRTFRFYNWFHPTQGQTFVEYMAARPARLRNTIDRKARKLGREHSYTIRLYSDNCLQQALSDYNTVYTSSWKANELYGAFIGGLANRLSASGWLRLGILYASGKPIAAQLWFVVHGRASIFKLAYDEQWRHYSPGSILTAYMMKQVIDIDKVTEIDFLTGNDAYKCDWMSERRERWTLYCINKPKDKRNAPSVLKWFNHLLSN